MTARVAVLGGSAVATPQLAACLAREPLLVGEHLDLVLIGRAKEKLARVADAARVAAAGGDCAVEVQSETDVERGLLGATFVVNQVRAGGLQARAFDETFPHELGLPGEETMGPGGFANAWRTIPVVEELFRVCSAVAPRAKLLNLTNPAGMVHQMAASAGLDVLTLCDSPITLARTVSAAIGAEGAEPGYVGTNHGGWLTSLHLNGDDVLARVLERADDLGPQLGFDAALLRWLGAVPNVYLRYVYYPERQLAEQLRRGRARAEELLELEAEALRRYGAGGGSDAIAGKRRAVWYTECIVPVVAAILSQTPLTIIAGVTNGSLLSWLPPETMLEVPVKIADSEIRPIGVDPLAPDAAALLLENAVYESLAVRAIAGVARDECVRALAANPLVGSVDLAARTVELIEARFGPLGSR